MVTKRITKNKGETVNWSVSAPGYITQSGSLVLIEDTILNINLQRASNPVTVTFNPGSGGTVSPTSKIVNVGEAYGDLPTPTKTNYTFQGWYTSSSGGTQITSSTVVSETTDHTVYAHWTEVVRTITVTFNPNGGTTPTSSKTVTVGQTYGDLPIPTYSGYTFDGWYTLSSGGTKITSSSVVSSETDQTLYAHWTVIQSITVTFNPNGGTTSIVSKTVRTGQTYGTIPEPTYSGYVFEGWYMGGEEITSSTIVTETSDHTVWALWKSNTNWAVWTGGTAFITFENYRQDLASPVSKSAHPSSMKEIVFDYIDSPYVEDEDTTAISYIDGTHLESFWIANCSITKIPFFDTSSISDMNSMFSYCSKLEEIPRFDTSNVTSARSMFVGCSSLTTVPKLDASNLKFFITMFSGCTSLSDFGGLSGLGSGFSFGVDDISQYGSSYHYSYGDDLDLSDCPLTHQSALNVLNELSTIEPNAGYEVKFASSVNLTPEEANIGYQKGWRITGFTPTTSSHTITFNANGGTIVQDFTKVVYNNYPYSYTSPNDYYGSFATAYRDGYDFSGWYTEQTGGTRITDNTIVSITENQTLYAHWELVRNNSEYFARYSGTENDIGGYYASAIIGGRFYGKLQSPILKSSYPGEEMTMISFGWWNYVDFLDYSSLENIWFDYGRNTSYTNIDLSNVNSMIYMFSNCTRLTSLPLLDASNVTNINNAFNFCNSLTDFGGLQGLGAGYKSNTSKGDGSLDLSYCPLTHESALNVLNGLANVDSTKEYTVTFKASTYNTLTASEKAIGSQKGWVITSA